MLSTAKYLLDNTSLFTEKALYWASLFNSACFLHSQGYKNDSYSEFDTLVAAGVQEEFIAGIPSTNLSSLQVFLAKYPQRWIPGFLSYDLKNELEELQSRHENHQNIPHTYFFVPQHVIIVKDREATIESHDPAVIFQEINNIQLPDSPFVFEGEIKAKMDKKAYTKAFWQLQQHIHKGDIYEVNLCQEFFAEQVNFTPLEAYKQLSIISPSPFSCYFKVKEHHIISASPERFLAKRSHLLVSQPIKGTAPRGKTVEEDHLLIEKLKANKKEISENIMIVDLVRNDLTRVAVPTTVQVKELMGVYTFKQVHQLISTITAQEKDNLDLIESIKHLFPAGSMTGAPKISAMKLIDQYETSRRGLYAGAIGYFNPQGDYDFNVVIRTLFFNSRKKRLSFHVGGAITVNSKVEEEYQECLLKAKAIMELLGKL